MSTKNEKLTRLETIKRHLWRHGYITPGIALLEYGMTNGLAQRIEDLRKKEGWAIETLTGTEPISGRRVTRYLLLFTNSDAENDRLTEACYGAAA